ncbi:MAG TPA: peptide-methionine (S)-S-oxide reductase MsrA [Candidatus Saccharimonadales bacterium]|nr:peptide-methionine (S)-S-oxide reductase MsrA [Candidatus Saccharimonadales bacterium]
MAVAVFAGGCFWCTEAIFKMLKGVKSVEPGYAGGITPNPNYHSIGDHAEAVKIEYDPAEIDYEKLLTVFFATHDPTTLNRQGADVGPQYRSLVLYTTEEQKTAAEKFIVEINASNQDGNSVVTKVQPLDHFYLAENYHRDYFSNHSREPYCQIVINPKLDKVKKQFGELLK